ncbi:MAG TPA: DUF177 domain-containing protein [Cyclobacteriaceae bacterium]|nr:DUF177 domain-containing protein [Cyclobacteriaceae bacterium]
MEQDFFKVYGTELLQKGSLNAKIKLDKRETLIEAHFEIEGIVELNCDRSLETFEQAVKVNKRMVFKYGHQEMELSDDIVLITHETSQLDLGQFIYEFIALEVPMKKLHPRFRNEADDEAFFYTSGNTEANESDIDPRWEKLKKLK